MSEHVAEIDWKRGGADFRYETYPRDHLWRFAGGVEVPASSAPDYLGSAARVDPEEALVASLSSCHMLTFLALAAKRRLVVESYRDRAVGTLAKNDAGRLAVTRVVLRPEVRFAEPQSEELVAKLHHQAHENCFIANSVRTEVVVEPPAG